MNNGTLNAKFLNSVDQKMKNAILENIAKHYGISQQLALEEVTDELAENIMEYITGPNRAAFNLIYQRFIFRNSK
jgi:hypothetical protein